MRILFLHGWTSIPGGVKPTFLKDHGHTVINPALDDDDFDAAVRTSQAEYDQHKPDVIVGSSRGGAVAMNIDSNDTPLVLLCPAWKNWGTATSVKPNTIILHSRQDDVIPFADSDELINNSGQPLESLVEVGQDHRLTVRDYDREERGTGLVKSYGVREENGKRYIIFQVWDFEDEVYDLSMYFVVDDGTLGPPVTHVMRTKYNAVGTDHLLSLMREADARSGIHFDRTN